MLRLLSVSPSWGTLVRRGYTNHPQIKPGLPIMPSASNVIVSDPKLTHGRAVCFMPAFSGPGAALTVDAVYEYAKHDVQVEAFREPGRDVFLEHMVERLKVFTDGRFMTGASIAVCGHRGTGTTFLLRNLCGAAKKAYTDRLLVSATDAKWDSRSPTQQLRHLLGLPPGEGRAATVEAELELIKSKRRAMVVIDNVSQYYHARNIAYIKEIEMLIGSSTGNIMLVAVDSSQNLWGLMRALKTQPWLVKQFPVLRDHMLPALNETKCQPFLIPRLSLDPDHVIARINLVHHMRKHATLQWYKELFYRTGANPRRLMQGCTSQLPSSFPAGQKLLYFVLCAELLRMNQALVPARVHHVMVSRKHGSEPDTVVTERVIGAGRIYGIDHYRVKVAIDEMQRSGLAVDWSMLYDLDAKGLLIVENKSVYHASLWQLHCAAAAIDLEIHKLAAAPPLASVPKIGSVSAGLSAQSSHPPPLALATGAATTAAYLERYFGEVDLTEYIEMNWEKSQKANAIIKKK